MLSIPQEIKDKMTKLQAEMECLKLNISTLVVDDPFEWLVVAQTENNRKMIELYIMINI